MHSPANRLLLGLLLWASLPLAATQAAETDEGVTISVADAVAKVGETALVVARVDARPGFVIAENYRNAVMRLSAEDMAVEFPNRRVRAIATQDGGLLFKVAVIPKKPGPHPINGIMRFAFVGETDGKSQLDIKVAPLIATVTGME